MALRVFILAVVVYLVAVAGALFAPQRSARPTQAAPPPRAIDVPASRTLPQLVGMTLNLYHSDQPQLYFQAIDSLVAMGFNSVQITTPIFQRDGAADQVEILTGPGRAPSREQLVDLLKYAKSRGLVTVLMPQIGFTHSRGNEWRGKIYPARGWRFWWASYTRVLDEYLDIASAADVDVFCVGCELLTTQTAEHRAAWRSLIGHARQRFDGALTYSTNWDSYERVEFWGLLDAIGISAYWDLARQARDPAHPTPHELATRWAEIRAQVLSYAEDQHRPVLFTELGYPSLPWALSDPWNYVNSQAVPADPHAQARGYAAFLEAWDGLILPPYAAEAAVPAAPLAVAGEAAASVHWRLPDPRVAGVLFYRWDPYHQGGPADTGYGTRGKPAHDLLERWLAGGDDKVTR